MKIYLLAFLLVPFYSFSQEKQNLSDLLDGKVYETQLIYLDNESKEVLNTMLIGMVEFVTKKGTLIITKQTHNNSSKNEEYFQQKNLFEIKNNALFLKGDMFGPIKNTPLKLTNSPIPSEYHLTTTFKKNNKEISVILQ